MKSTVAARLVFLLSLAPVIGQAMILVNFHGTDLSGPYTPGGTTWNNVDYGIDSVNPADAFATYSGLALVDTANAATGITLDLANTNGGGFLNVGASEAQFTAAQPGSGFEWYDPSVANLRETGVYSGSAGADTVTYTFGGFAASDTVEFDFVIGRNNTGDRRIDFENVTAAQLLLDDVNTASTAHFVTTTVSGSTSYEFRISRPVEGDAASAMINALAITVTPETLDPGVHASITSPVDASVVYADDPLLVEVDVTAVDTVVDQVDLIVNGAYFGSDATAPYEFDLGYVAEGALNLSATAYGADASEDTDTAAVTVAAPLARAWTRQSIDTGINGADGARAADVDGDGDMDLIVAFEEDATVRIYQNPGIGTAINGNWSYVSFNSSGLASIEDANLADLDGDGRLDFVASMEGTNRKLTVYWAPTAPTDYWNSANWTAMTIPAAAGQDWMYSQVLDIDGQNGPDIVAGSKGNVAGSDPATVSWFAAPADPRVGSNWTGHTMTAAGWIMSVEPSDMDGDTDLDIVISDRRSGGLQQSARWLENPGSGSPSLTSAWTSHTIAGAGSEVMFLDIVDLDDDGLDDVIVPLLQGTATDQWLYAQRLDATGTSWSVTTIDYPDGTNVAGGTGDGKATISVDVDGDGVLDVVSSHGMAFSPIQGMVWGKHDGDPVTGNWTWYSIAGPNGEKFDRIVAMDLDGDGDLDLISTDEDESLVENGLGVMLYENPGGDVQATATQAELWRLQWFGYSANAGVAADVVDFDNDGLVNLLERAFGSNPTLADLDPLTAIPPVESVIEDAGRYLALTYRRLKGGSGTTGVDYTADGLTYTVEYDNDLSDPWSSGLVVAVGSPADNGAGTETVTVRLSTTVSSAGTQFIRLKVTGD